MITFTAQTVFTGRGDKGQQRGALIQARQFGQVAAASALRPAFHFGQQSHRGAIGQQGFATGQCQPVWTQITGSAFEQSQTHRQAKGRGQAWQISGKELVLQRLGGGAHQHPLTTEQGRHQIGKGLAHPGARFHHQAPPVLDGVGHRKGHLGLAATRTKARIRPGQHAVGTKRFLNGSGETQGACRFAHGGVPVPVAAPSAPVRGTAGLS